MLDFHEKRKLKRFILSRAALLVLLAAVIVLGNATLKLAGKERETRKKVDERAAELALLSAREEALARDIERLSTPRGLEEELRRKFEVAGEGEGVIILIDPGKGASSASPAGEADSLFTRFLGWIAGE